MDRNSGVSCCLASDGPRFRRVLRKSVCGLGGVSGFGFNAVGCEGGLAGLDGVEICLSKLRGAVIRVILLSIDAGFSPGFGTDFDKPVGFDSISADDGVFGTVFTPVGCVLLTGPLSVPVSFVLISKEVLVGDADLDRAVSRTTGVPVLDVPRSLDSDRLSMLCPKGAFVGDSGLILSTSVGIGVLSALAR